MRERSFQIHQVEGFLEKRSNTHSNKIIRYRLKVILGNNDRGQLRRNRFQLFQQSGTICIRKMIFNDRNRIMISLDQRQRFTCSGATVKGIPSPFQKFFQRTPQRSVIFNKQNKIFNIHVPPPSYGVSKGRAKTVGRVENPFPHGSAGGPR